MTCRMAVLDTPTVPATILQKNVPSVRSWTITTGPNSNSGTSKTVGSLLMSVFHQVLGHTPSSHFRVKCDAQSENWCIAVTSMTGVTQILVIEGDTVRLVGV